MSSAGRDTITRRAYRYALKLTHTGNRGSGNLQLQQPIHLSSGNLIADRRFEWARDCEAKGDLAGAADLLVQALELAPGYAAGLVRAWSAASKNWTIAPARSRPLTQARAADPQDRHGAALQLARLGACSIGAMPERYIRTLFDGYAAAFDKALTEGLSYRAPELLFRAVVEAQAEGRNEIWFGARSRLRDRACGASIPPYSDWMVGVDLSPACWRRRARKACTIG